MAYIRKRSRTDGDSYSVRWRDLSGVLRTKECPNHKTAKQIKAEVELSRFDGKDWVVEPDVPVPTVKEVFRGFLREQSISSRPRTIGKYASNLDTFLRWLRDCRPEGEGALVSVLSKSVMVEFYKYASKHGRHGKGRSAGTMNKLMGPIYNAWEWAQNDDRWEGLVPSVKRFKMPKVPRVETRAPTWEEMDRCIAACNGWHRHLGLVLRFTGLRVGQVMLLLWSDFDFEAATLTVRPELGKTAYERMGRTVPVSKFLLGVMEGWKRPEERTGFLIDSGRDQTGPRAREARARDMERAWERAKVPEEKREQPHHCFRKGFKSGLVREAADWYAVERLLGHKIGSGEGHTYTDPDFLPLREAADAIPPLTNHLKPVTGQGRSTAASN